MPDRHIRLLPAWLRTAIVTAALPGLALAQTPRGVSPGSATDVLLTASSCPSFSWSGTKEALGYELIVYEVGDDGTLSPLLQKELAGDARAWAPPAAQCPDAGGRYAWTVRVMAEDGPGRWSELLLFTTPGAPTQDEVRRALSTLRRFQQGPESDPTTVASGVAVRRQRERTMASHTELRRYPQETTGDDSEALTSSSVSAEPSPQAVTTPASFSLNLDGDLALGGSLFKDGYPLLHNDQSPTHYNTAVGFNALPSTTPSGANGVRNTAVGHEALELNTQGFRNTATGFKALASNIGGHRNVANGHLALFSNTSGFRNTALGNRALYDNQNGYANTAVGDRAMQLNETGYDNTAIGYRALHSNTSGARNVVVGVGALSSNLIGSDNTGIGYRALYANDVGFRNTAMGYRALDSNEEGTRNTAVGFGAMRYNTSGSLSTAIGYKAGYNWTEGGSNIALGRGVEGVAGESAVIRIGSQGLQTKAFIAGIRGISTGNADAVTVMIDSAGQLGTMSSSASTKEDIQNLGGQSERIQDLRPVEFRYKRRFADGTKPIQFGLIAEEVAEVLPDLVVYDQDGRPETVKYHLLTPLLLAEIQRQETALRDRHAAVVELREQVAALQRRVEGLARKKRFR